MLCLIWPTNYRQSCAGQIHCLKAPLIPGAHVHAMIEIRTGSQNFCELQSLERSVRKHIRHLTELHKLLAGLHAPSCSPDPQDRASYTITPGKVRTFAVLRSGECERPFPVALTFCQSKVSCPGKYPYRHQSKVSCADRRYLVVQPR